MANEAVNKVIDGVLGAEKEAPSREDLLDIADTEEARQELIDQTEFATKKSRDFLRAEIEKARTSLGEEEREQAEKLAVLEQELAEAETNREQKRRNPGAEEKKSFMEELKSRDTAGKFALVMEKIGEFAEKIADFFESMGSTTLLSVASLMEKMGMDAAWVEGLRAMAGKEKAIIQSKLQAENFTLIKDIAVDGKTKDGRAIAKLKQKYESICKEKLEEAVRKTSAAPTVPPAVLTMKTIKTQYSFENFMEERIMPVIQRNEWTLKMPDDKGRKQLNLSDIVHACEVAHVLS